MAGGVAGPARIDTHQHLVPPAYRRALDRRGGAQGWRIPDRDPATAIRMMDAGQRHAIERGNAEVLIPRLARPALR